jgi:hypothetical protein
MRGCARCSAMCSGCPPGGLPGSLAVANFLTGFEERFSVLIDDDDVAAEDFATYGQLLAFGERLSRR